MIKLSKKLISSYIGDVIPLWLEGDGIEKNSPITWRAEGNVASVRTFSGEGKCAFTYGVLVTLVKEGDGRVIATYDGVEYLTDVKARAMETVSSEGDFEYLVGDMHCHTTDIHEFDKFALHEQDDITDLINYVKDKDPIDLTVITDHADVTNDHDFFRGFVLAEDCKSPFIFAGAESEIMYTENDRYDIIHRHSGELVTLMSAGYINCKTYEEFEREILLSPEPIGIFAHPHVVGYSTKGIWNFDFAHHNTDNMLHIMRGVELGNGGDNKENMLHEYAYSQALDAGFKVSVTQSSDSHGPTWGYDCLSGKTVILAKEKSREAMHDAFRNNRFYACETGNVKLKYRVNGAAAPATLPLTDTYDFHIELDYFKDDATTVPTLCQVISDYGDVAYECKVAGDILDFTVKSGTARYFYLKFIDELGRKTWSMPVWTSREFDKPKAFNGKAIDMSSFSAYTSKKDAKIAINNDPFDPFFSEEKLPSLIIDMNEEREITALSYYPRIVLRQNHPVGWNTRDEAKTVVSRFKVHVSLDGKDYTEVASKTCQTLGSETFVTFPHVRARFVKFEVLGNVGIDTRRENYADTETVIGNIALFE